MRQNAETRHGARVVLQTINPRRDELPAQARNETVSNHITSPLGFESTPAEIPNVNSNPSHKGVTVYDTSNFMPPQAPPIDRTPSGPAAISSQSGVDASIWRPPGTPYYPPESWLSHIVF
jgi:hypothetical protein